MPSGTDQNIDQINNASTADFLKTPPLMLSYQKQGIFNPGAATTLSNDDILTIEGVVPWGGLRRGGDRDGDGLPDGAEAAPPLEIARTTGAIRVEWTHEGPDFFLESRELSPPHSWGPELRVRPDGGGRHTLELPLPLPPGMPPSAISRLRRTW